MDQLFQGSRKNYFFSKIFATMPSRRVLSSKTNSLWEFLSVKDFSLEIKISGGM